MTNIPEGMKPFDLEAAKRGEPICTRDGRDVPFFAYADVDSLDQKVVAIVMGEGYVRHFCDDGRYYTSDISCNVDLFMRKRKVRKEVYVVDRGGVMRIVNDPEEVHMWATSLCERVEVKKAILEIEE